MGGGINFWIIKGANFAKLSAGEGGKVKIPVTPLIKYNYIHGEIMLCNIFLTVSDVSEITEKFNTNRSHKPAMFVATPQDRFSSCWTRPNPIPPVLARIQVLARESRALLLSQLECCDLSSVDLRVRYMELHVCVCVCVCVYVCV